MSQVFQAQATGRFEVEDFAKHILRARLRSHRPFGTIRNRLKLDAVAEMSATRRPLAFLPLTLTLPLVLKSAVKKIEI
jgi:hypothetical protein